MRNDMVHVLTEKPVRAADCSKYSRHFLQTRLKNRYRSAKAFHLTADGDVCDGYSGGKLPMRHRMQGYDRKAFAVRLSVLVRYLERHVGEPWDAVHAEICKTACRKAWLTRWLMLEWLVPAEAEAHGLRPGQLYVEAHSGLLKRWAQ